MWLYHGNSQRAQIGNGVLAGAHGALQGDSPVALTLEKTPLAASG